MKLLLFLIFGGLTPLAFGQSENSCFELLEDNPIFVTIDKDKYKVGETVFISGCVADPFFKGINIFIKDPSGGIYSGGSQVLNLDSTFDSNITLDKEFTLPGIYVVEVEYGGPIERTSFIVSTSSKIDSPYQQYKEGISFDHVQCKPTLVLMIKESTGLPTCVKETSVKRLLSSAWILGPISENTPEDNIVMRSTNELMEEFTKKDISSILTNHTRTSQFVPNSGELVLINGEEITIFEYSNLDDARIAYWDVSSTLNEISPYADFMCPQTYFYNGVLMVEYVGSSKETTAILEDVMGSIHYGISGMFEASPECQ